MAHQPPDFIAETKGYCFLCSKSTSCNNTTNVFKSESFCSMSSLSSSICSIHCLSRYLKVDMGKVFTGDGPIPPHLLARVKKSRLKTELCAECANLTENFANLFRQLEKLEIEVGSCLKIIHGKLEGATKLDKLASRDSWNVSSKLDEWAAKLEITEALRKDVKQKCSRKLRAVVRPLTKLQRLTPDQVTAKKLKIKSANTATQLRRGCQSQHLEFESNFEDVDIQLPASVSVSNENGDDYQDEPDDCLYSSAIMDESSLPPKHGTVKQEVVEGTPVSDGMELDNKMEMTDVSEPQHTISTTQADQLSRAIPPPLRIEGRDGLVEIPDVSKIKVLETGKYKCPICSKEYGHKTSFQLHYRSAHLKVGFKCGVCQNDFRFKHVYERHYLNIHMGVRFQCGKCNKTFRQKALLKLHQKNDH